MLAAALLPPPSLASSLTVKDVQIIARVLGFLDPPSRGGVVAVVYTAGSPASQADAIEVAALFGTGVIAGPSTIRAEAVAASSLGNGTHYAAVILASGVTAEALTPVIRANQMLCITADVGQVQAGHCILAIRSDPRVDIVLNRELAAAAGIGFATAFRMLVHEI